MSATDTTSAEFFEAKYRGDVDPWRFASDRAELSRYDTILHALGGRRFHHAWEPGCSVGVLTERLAAIADRVDASDLSSTAARRAEARCAALPGVKVRCASLADSTPPKDCDLAVLSEIGYYFPVDEWERQANRMTASLPLGSTVLAVHWLGHSPDHVLSGDAVHAVLMRTTGLVHEHGERHANDNGGFRLDRWRREQ